jgi:hypothetical protein
MTFQAKKLRVALPAEKSYRAAEPQILPLAFDLDAVSDEAASCFAAVHPIVTEVAQTQECWDLSSGLVYYLPVWASAETLPTLRDALEAQLAQVSLAEQALARRPAEG